jgi:transposase-like protein
MALDNKLIDEMLKQCKTPEDITGKGGLLSQLTKAVMERALEGEMTHHLGYKKNDYVGNNSGNSRNGKTKKKIIGKNGSIDLKIPRDRNGEFEPQIIKKRQKRFDGFDDKIISMYARGMTTREIQAHLHEIYEVDVSPDLISTVTQEVIEEVRDWQNRPLDSVYPIIYLDCLFVKIKNEGHVKNRAVYLAIAINMEGKKEVLGLWVEQTEGAKFWLKVINELKTRGVDDIFIACVDGLKGFPEAIETVYPETEIQLCIVHMVRHSLKYVGSKNKKTVAQDLKKIYSSATVEKAADNLDIFEEKYREQYPAIIQSWRRHWDLLTTFMAYHPDVRKVIYTTNTIESLNMTMRKVIKNRSSFPSDESATKLLFLALRNASKKWTMPVPNWGAALNQFAIMFPDRMER